MRLLSFYTKMYVLMRKSQLKLVSESADTGEADINVVVNIFKRRIKEWDTLMKYSQK